MSAPHGRLKGCQPHPKPRQRRTVVAPFLGKGVGEKVVQ